MTERSLIGVISRQLGSEIAKHTIASNISTIEDFAQMLNVWEEIDKEQRTGRYNSRSEVYENNNRWDHHGNWKNNQGRRPGYNGERLNGYGQNKENRGREQQWDASREITQESDKDMRENHQNSTWRGRGRARGKDETLN